jgi:Doubled CXXCH motif (Paired_CXXCH_1)
MRIRTAKQRAQRIDLYYFTHARGMRRLRILLSTALPVAALLWIGGIAAAGSRKPYSAGPVSSAHAFAEAKCEVCHRSAEHAEYAARPFRRHTTDGACLTCHDAPPHAANQTPAPSCAVCHRDHRGRVQLAKTDDGFCVECHGELKTAHGDSGVAKTVRTFPGGHPEFAAVRAGAPPDPGQLRFNHAVHLKDDLRGPGGPEKLECSACHTPEVGRAAGVKKPAATGLMEPISYQQQCARCHPLFFDERIGQAAPHAAPEHVRAFVRQSLAGYIAQHPHDISKPDSAVRRVPLNFPRPAEPPAKSAAEWVERRAAVDERVLWIKTCAECHEPETGTLTVIAGARTTAVPEKTVGVPVSGLPAYAPTRIPRHWMPRAAFDHTPHAVVNCESCHAARGSTKTSDVLLPGQAACAACHAPSKGAESRCFECHQYHDWTKAHQVQSPYTLGDFK